MLRSWSRVVARPVLVFTLSIAIAETTNASAPPRQAPAPQAAPAPSETDAQSLLARARTVFIQNNGASDAFPADANAGYQRFVAAMRQWGRYQVVDSVRQADVVIQFRSSTSSSVLTTTGDDPSPSVIYTPYFHLTIADPVHLTPLWTVASVVATGSHKGVDRFDTSVENAVSQIKLLTGAPLTAQEQAALRLPDQIRHSRHILAYSLVGGMVAAGVAGGLILHHEYSNSVKAMQQQSEQWCIANGFPVVDCE